MHHKLSKVSRWSAYRNVKAWPVTQDCVGLFGASAWSNASKFTLCKLRTWHCRALRNLDLYVYVSPELCYGFFFNMATCTPLAGDSPPAESQSKDLGLLYIPNSILLLFCLPTLVQETRRLTLQVWVATAWWWRLKHAICLQLWNS